MLQLRKTYEYYIYWKLIMFTTDHVSIWVLQKPVESTSDMKIMYFQFKTSWSDQFLLTSIELEKILKIQMEDVSQIVTLHCNNVNWLFSLRWINVNNFKPNLHPQPQKREKKDTLSSLQI